MAQQQLSTANFPKDELGRPVRPMPVLPINPDGSPAGFYTPLGISADRSGVATPISGNLAIGNNPARRGIIGQNVGSNNIGFNEFGGVAAIGTAGTFTVVPGASFRISTTNGVNFIAPAGNTPVTMTEY
jgi:hypothetical protein